ncbi:MAG: NADH-quinone oxidoreductase subunit NuoH [Verrucomicrobiota bacterium]
MLVIVDQIFVIAKQQLLALLGFAPAWVLQIISSLINIAGILGVFLTLFALISLFERKILARFQNRYGPNRVGPFGLLQPVADGIKMLIKEDIVPRNSDAVIHFLAPIAMVVPTMLALAVIPYGHNMTAFSIDGGILFFFAVGSATELAVFMAGWASDNKYSMLGAMRAIAQMMSYELPLIIAVLPVVMIVGSLSPDAIVAAQGRYVLGIVPHWFVLTPWGFVGFILFYIAALVESNRTPFDLPEGESEIIAGHMIEYSGFKYAIFFMAEYFGMFAISGLGVTLFLGGWHAPLPFLEFIPSYLWFFLKLSVLLFIFIWLRGTLPRIRIDHMMMFAWKFMLPMTFACVIAAAIWHYAGGGITGWFSSLLVLAVAFPLLTLLLKTRQNLSVRTYHFAE